jgi:hypothetical protein
MRRKRMQRRPLWPAIEASPQTPSRIRPELEVAIERKFDDIGCGDERCLFEPNTMLYAAQM